MSESPVHERKGDGREERVGKDVPNPAHREVSMVDRQVGSRPRECVVVSGGSIE